MPKVRRRVGTEGGVTDHQILDWLTQFVGVDSQIKTLSKRTEELRGKLMGVLESVGWIDNKGHRHLELEVPFADPLPGSDRKITGMEAIQNVRQNLNAERTETLLRKRGLYKEASKGGCLRFVAEIDEDALAAARYRGLITDDEFEGLIDRKVWYSFKPVRS